MFQNPSIYLDRVITTLVHTAILSKPDWGNIFVSGMSVFILHPPHLFQTLTHHSLHYFKNFPEILG